MEDRAARRRGNRRRDHRDVAGRPALSAAAALTRGHPGLAPYAAWLEEGRCPDLATLNGLARERGLALPDGRPLSFVPSRTRLAALDYERAIQARGEIATREGNRHDAFNALAWLRFPRAKSALNAVHVRGSRAATGNARDRARDAATLLDESGLLLCCGDVGLAALLRAHAWRELFVTHRDDVERDLQPWAIGHGLLEKLDAPYRALTAHVLVVAADPKGTDAPALDAAAANVIAAPDFGPGSLTPLPVAALPGWDAERLGERLFDDVSVFRSRVLR